ncbi:MAG: hypothetical protein ACRDNY_04555 [Gaiellaceae bacterium]
MDRAFVLRGASVLDESCSFSGPLDVRVEDGAVAAVCGGLQSNDAAELDFSGLWLMPGVFDCHLHAAWQRTSE